MSTTVVAFADAPRELLDDYSHLRDAGRRGAIERERNCFVVEGLFALEQLLASTYTPRSVLVDPGQLDAVGERLPSGCDLTVIVAPRDEVEQLAGFAFHRGVLAIGERPPPRSVAEVVRQARRVLVIEGVNDHENLGGLFRNAAAFGVDAVVLDPTAADPLYRRVVRVSVGHVLRVATARATAWPADLDLLRDAGIVVAALSPASDAVPLAVFAATAPERLALAVGAEGPGLSTSVLARADHRVRIPIDAQVDSLNVATAAAIALYELDQR